MTKSHKELYSQHPEYNARLNEKLSLLYKGGFAIQQRANLFLEQLQGLEDGKAYQRRLKSVAYIPYLSEFITQFGASLFSEELEVKQPVDAADTSTLGEAADDDYYKDFLQACDLMGRPLHQFMHEAFETALHQLKVYIGIDFPKNETGYSPLNRLMEKQMGMDAAYLYTIPYETVIDWKCDEQGNFVWLKMFEECQHNDDPLAEPKHYYRFKIWTLKNGKGHWQVWETEIMPMNKTVSSSTKYTMKEEGDTSFPAIPIYDFCVPQGYHVGQQIGSICQEHYQRRSFMVSNANKTCVSLGVVKLGPEIGAPGDAIPADIEPMDSSQTLRSKLESDGWTVVRKTAEWEDDIEIVEAKGESHKFIAEELKHLVEAMMQTLRQMNMTATAQQKALGRSASSKQMDQHGTSMLLSVYKTLVTEFVRRLMSLLAAGRGREEKIAWVVEGLSTAEPPQDRKDIVDEVVQLGVDIKKLPDIFQSRYYNKIANELLDNSLSDKEKLELQEKIEEMVISGGMQEQPMDPSQSNNPGNTPANKKGAVSGSDPSTDDSDSPLIGESGNMAGFDGMHLADAEHVDPQVVYDQLAEDYKEKDIQFVLSIDWVGPVEVPLTSIDFSNSHNWAASEDQDHVNDFADQLSQGIDTKPIILVNSPSNNKKMAILDGHHRALAHFQAGKDIPAYVGNIGKLTDDMKKLHSRQASSKQESSQQEQSIQKEASQQVAKSETAKNGKTK